MLMRFRWYKVFFSIALYFCVSSNVVNGIQNVSIKIDEQSVKNIKIPYNCTNGDYACLKKYILNVSRFFGYDNTFFKEATLKNTSFLRQYVHYMNFEYKKTDRSNKDYYFSTGSMYWSSHSGHFFREFS